MSAFEALAERFERLRYSGYRRALETAAVEVQAKLEVQLAAHHRSGTAEGSLKVTVSGKGLSVDQTRYQQFIKGVAKGEALQQIAADAFNRAVAAQVAGT